MVCWTGLRDRSVKPIVWSETASLEYQNLVRRIGADSPGAARSQPHRRGSRRIGSTKHWQTWPGERHFREEYRRRIVAFAVEVHDGVERIVVLRVIHTARHWPPGKWPKP